MHTLNVSPIVWRGTTSPANAVAASDAMKFDLRHSFLWTHLLGKLLAASSGREAKEKSPPKEGTFSSLAGGHTDGGFAPLC